MPHLLLFVVDYLKSRKCWKSADPPSLPLQVVTPTFTYAEAVHIVKLQLSKTGGNLLGGSHNTNIDVSSALKCVYSREADESANRHALDCAE